MLELCDRVVTHAGHEADLMIDQDECGVVGCERVVGPGWVGHGILLEKRKMSCGCRGRGTKQLAAGLKSSVKYLDIKIHDMIYLNVRQ
jgi:hypothetical protein